MQGKIKRRKEREREKKNMYNYMQVSKIKSNFTALKNVQANSTSIQQYYIFFGVFFSFLSSFFVVVDFAFLFKSTCYSLIYIPYSVDHGKACHSTLRKK